MENAAVELHDTRLLKVRAEGDDLVLELSAYVHRSLGRPGVDAGTGWEQSATLTITGATLLQRPAQDPLWISDGSAWVDGAELDNHIPVPFDVSGRVRVLLYGHEGVLEATGTGARLTLHGTARYIENFP